ncbi:trehalase [Holotrichia oblita]|uniref:Trehalase n=2 Tax=Holotrichia oblita TaxID=644536 RepID=A0ACB9SMI8_HOLOL|nr:trehalase [Holotrichia oblita]KAI4456202.1 trehalase [Holotrichia oblita]
MFNDSKTFVDMKMKKTVFETVGNFHTLMTQYEDEPSREVLESFVRDHFEAESELEDWFPPDFNPEPRFLKKLKTPKLKISRRGGRFREVYYWDTYWIINGLLISEMYETAKGMIDNFIYMVKIYGFVPNGGRIYYAQRSQPPLLTPMAANYIRYTNDLKWLEKNIIYLKREIKFWRRKRIISVEKYDQEYQLAYYAVEGYGPRPESYHEDVDLTTHLDTEKEKEEIFSNIKSAVQSGWDFSSRWIYDDKGDSRANLSFTQAKYIVPVDLNSFLHKAYMSMSYLYGKLGNHERRVYWSQKAQELHVAIKEILWNEEDNMWYDFNLKLKEHRRKYYASNVTPLWTGAYHASEGRKYGKMVSDYLKRHGILDYKGGIPTSLEYSGQQWDFPNAWPPLQAIVVQGLENSGHPEAKALARELSRRWVTANLQGFKETGEMFEKYNSVEVGKYGAGGEYTTQTGFGWTNGVNLEFIVTYFSAY